MTNLILFLTTIMSTIFLSFIENIEIATKVVFIIINAILLILTICNFIYTKIKSKKIAKAINANDEARAAEIQREGNPFEKLIEIVENSLPNIIELAESTSTNGIAKKFIAMSQLMIKCNENGINYNDFQNILSQMVDNFVSMSRKVNIYPKEAEQPKEIDKLNESFSQTKAEQPKEINSNVLIKEEL